MTKTILEIILSGSKIFTAERRRHFSKELLELQHTVDLERAKVFPEYNDARKAKAEKNLANFIKAYGKEFDKAVTELLAKVATNE